MEKPPKIIQKAKKWLGLGVIAGASMLPNESQAQVETSMIEDEPSIESVRQENTIREEAPEKTAHIEEAYEVSSGASLESLESEKRELQAEYRKIEAEYEQIINKFLVTLKESELFLAKNGDKEAAKAFSRADILPKEIKEAFESLVQKRVGQEITEEGAVEYVFQYVFNGTGNDEKSSEIASTFQFMLAQKTLGTTIDQNSQDIQRHVILGEGYKDQVKTLLEMQKLQRQISSLDEQIASLN
ncbi:hypothetical protein KC842_00340 [Candidatus Nomurabacteria bacterium]|nr:hypothetical protein [Candidatus Nomurabacteria bacterium]USN94827.1 MAG: hypothetical protein H6791_00115 [Candidatus Nomurabacteria bacterium]